MGEARSGVPLQADSLTLWLSSTKPVAAFDETFKHSMDWGLGFVANSSMYGAETVPYGMADTLPRALSGTVVSSLRRGMQIQNLIW